MGQYKLHDNGALPQKRCPSPAEVKSLQKEIAEISCGKKEGFFMVYTNEEDDNGNITMKGHMYRNNVTDEVLSKGILHSLQRVTNN